MQIRRVAASSGPTRSDAGCGLSRVALVLADVVGVEPVTSHELESDRQTGLDTELEVVPRSQGHELPRRQRAAGLVVVVGHDENLVVLFRAAEEVLDPIDEAGGRRRWAPG